MKIKSAAFVNALTVALTQLRTTMTAVAYQKMQIKAVAGNFLIFREFFDNFSSGDDAVLGFFKTLTDNTAAAEAATLAFGKAFSDTGVFSEAHIFSHDKPLTDNAAVTDLPAISFARLVSDAFSASDAEFLRGVSINLESTTTVTDDVDGAASTEDDQEVQFFKVLTDAPTVSDFLASTVAFARAFTETTSATDAGSLRSQGYADFTYFAEDYVGASRTFT